MPACHPTPGTCSYLFDLWSVVSLALYSLVTRHAKITRHVCCKTLRQQKKNIGCITGGHHSIIPPGGYVVSILQPFKLILHSMAYPQVCLYCMYTLCTKTTGVWNGIYIYIRLRFFNKPYTVKRLFKFDILCMPE